MLPGSLLAAALLLSLVPGWTFLRLTERTRRPRDQSELQEVLELVTVGVATTGTAILTAAVLRLSGLFELAVPPESASDVRELGLSALVVLLMALGLAVVSAIIVLRTSAARQASLVTGVWWDVLKAQRVPENHVPYALITLSDDTEVEGIVDSFTWQSDASHRRVISLRSPVRFPAGKDASGNLLYRNPGFDLIIIAGDDVKQIALKYTPK